MKAAISRDYMRKLLLNGDLGFRFEEMLQRHYSRWVESGDVVVDVGAHDGLHTTELQGLVGASGKVFAFEPIPGKFDSLKRSIISQNVILMNSALSCERGNFDFVVVRDNMQKSGLRQRKDIGGDSDIEVISVPVECLDDYLERLGRVSFIKIDIEGAEINCLLGAESVIRNFRPLVSVEYGASSYLAYGCTEWSLYDLCQERNYVLYDIFLNRLGSRLEWQEGVDSVCWDYFMVPAEREIEFVRKVVLPERRESIGEVPLFFERNFSAENGFVELCSGFSCVESWGVWTDSEEAVIKVKMLKPSPNGFVVSIFGRGYVPRAGDAQEIDFFVMNEAAGAIRCCHSEGADLMKTAHLFVPGHAVKNGFVEVLVRVRNPLSPLEAGVSLDARRIGFALHGVSARESNSGLCIC